MVHNLVTHIKRWLHPTPPAPPSDPAPSGVAPDLAALPAWVAADPLVQKYAALLGPLPWTTFPERPTDRAWPGPRPHARAPFVAAFLIKLHEDIRFMADLRTFLIEHPALVVWLGFPRRPDPTSFHGFAVAASVPDRRQFSRVLRTLAPSMLDWVLSATIALHKDALAPDQQATFGDVVAGDTQAILAWVRENNPKECMTNRFDSTQQPRGDADCKVGIKRRRNITPEAAPPTPTTEPVPTATLQVGSDIFWGYATGIVTTALPDGTEIVLAERTRPFNESDISYFFPLMAQVEQRLGRRPPTGVWDTAFDAQYVYDYYHEAGGQAIVPFNGHGKPGAQRQFDADGRPLCAAGLGMPVRFTFRDRTSTLVPHERAMHGCPLLVPQPTGEICPVAHPRWAKGGCRSSFPTGAGARVRHQIDRDSDGYRALVAQRSMVERINSQAEALGLIRPKLRSGQAIANRNSLAYALINLRALARRRSTLSA